MKTKVSKKKLKKARVKSPARTHIFYPPVVQACSGTGPNVRTVAELDTPHLFFWKTREGQILRITDMQLDHLLNARALLRRRIAKQSEVEEAMSREIRKRTGSELKLYGEPKSAPDPMCEWYDNDPYDDHGQH